MHTEWLRRRSLEKIAFGPYLHLSNHEPQEQLYSEHAKDHGLKDLDTPELRQSANAQRETEETLVNRIPTRA